MSVPRVAELFACLLCDRFQGRVSVSQADPPLTFRGEAKTFTSQLPNIRKIRLGFKSLIRVTRMAPDPLFPLFPCETGDRHKIL